MWGVALAPLVALTVLGVVRRRRAQQRERQWIEARVHGTVVRHAHPMR